MKRLNISIMVLTFGLLATSCGNNAHCPPTAADSAATSASGNMASPADSISQDSIASATAGNNTPSAGNSSGVNATATGHRKMSNRMHQPAKDSTMQKEKKREGNFTNGTGADNIGK